MKTDTKKTVSNHASQTLVTDPVPHADAPSPPAGFVPPARLGRTLRPQHEQVELAPRVASELHGAGDRFVQEFGASPEPEPIAEALSNARAWSDKLRGASAWAKYVQQQEHLAWKHAMGLVMDLAAPFAYRASRDPSVVTRFPSLAAFLAAPKSRAQRGVTSRKRIAKEKQKEAQNAPKPEAPATAPGPAPVAVDPVKNAAVKLLN